MRIPKSKSQIRRGGIRRGGGLKLGSVSGWSCATLLLAALCHVTGVTVARAGDGGFCLPDADGDGHPLFGNPEVVLNPFAPQMGLNSLVPVSGAIGDIDNDGDVDAVATYAWPNPGFDPPETQVAVLLNKGDGVFVAEAVYDPGDFPSCAAIGDLNGDGLGDLAITNVLSGKVSVLLNAGPAAFPTRVAYSVGTKPRSVVVADLDNDSDLDLAVANGQANSVSVLENSGDGTFAPAASYPVANIPDSSVLFGSSGAFGGPYLAAGDLDGDTDLDLALPVSTGVSILKNNGDGTFGPHAVFPGGGATWAVAVGDIDGDTDADLLVANYAVDSLSVLKNNGNATFAAPVTFFALGFDDGGVIEPATVALGDLDHDADLDLACGLSTSAGYIAVWKNLGDGSFGELRIVPADETARVVAMAHLNGDAHVDVAVFTLDQVAEKLCSLLNDGSGTLLTDQTNYEPYYPPIPFYWNDPNQIAFADLDQDGDSDLVVLNSGQAQITLANVAILINSGGGVLSEPTFYPVRGFFPDRMVVADMDRDGVPDVLACGPEDTGAASSPGYLAVLLNSGTGLLTAPAVYATGGLRTRGIGVSDVDDDLDLDVVAANYFSNDISVLKNDGLGNLSSPATQSSPFQGPFFLAIGDMNCDGHADLALAAADGVEGVYLMFGNGDGTFVDGPFYAVPPQVAHLELADFDDDCDLDVAVSSRNTPPQPVSCSVLANDGSGLLAAPIQHWSPGTRDARAMASADLDSDGHLDLMVSTAGAASVFLGNVAGGFAPGVSYGSGLDIQGITTGDLDGDATVDIGTANRSSETFSILWNRRCQPRGAFNPADLEGDGSVGIADFAGFWPCLSGPEVCQPSPACDPPGVADADLDSDGDVDLHDVSAFLLEWSPQ